MSNIELHLFRVKFIRPKQMLLFQDSKQPGELLEEALNERPSSVFRTDYIWHIGNIEKVDDYGGSLAVGRTTKTTVSKFDSETKNFIDEYSEESPYTICLYDLQIGFLAIAKKTKLAPTTIGIAQKIKKLLDTTVAVMRNKIDVRIDPISDPEGFINKLSSAYCLKKFTAFFTGPNPFDADELFQKPLSVYCAAMNGEGGKVITEGNSLDTATTIEVSKSVAATGNQAVARIIDKQGRKPKNIHLAGDPVKTTIDPDEINCKIALNDMRSEYKRVRG